MKALVLCGGTGTRLRPITHTSAKQLIPIANKPVLFYGLEGIREAGIVQTGIVVGDTADEVRAAVGDGSSFGLEVTYIPQEAPAGLAHCILLAREFLGEEDFVLYLGDNLIVDGLTGVLDEFRQCRPDIQLLVAEVVDATRFGVAEVGSGGTVTAVTEKPAAPNSDLAVTGIYVFTPAIHDAVGAVKPSRRGELEISDAIQRLVDHGRSVRARLTTGYWKDVGEVDDVLDCNQAILGTLRPAIRGEVDSGSEIVGAVVVERGAKVIRSRVAGPAVIGMETVVTGANVGPYTSVGPRCFVENTEVESSLVMAGSGIRGAGRIRDSLIGREVEVTCAASVPRGHRLVLGDHSTARIAR